MVKVQTGVDVAPDFSDLKFDCQRATSLLLAFTSSCFDGLEDQNHLPTNRLILNYFLRNIFSY